MVIGLLAFFASAFGQDANLRSQTWWIDGGLGGFTTKGLSGDSYGGGLTMFTGKTFYTIRYLRNEEPSDFLIMYGPLPYEKYSSIDLMVGKGISKKYFLVQTSGGFGITTGIKRGSFLRSEDTFFGHIDYYERDRFTVPSLPLAFDFMFKPTGWLGLGFECFANLNATSSYGGYLFKLSLGRLR